MAAGRSPYSCRAVNQKVLPTPEVLAALVSPPVTSDILRVMAKSIPAPQYLQAMESPASIPASVSTRTCKYGWDVA